jgi:6-phosphogluconolactonase (cycloisomerase 2 family)
MLFLNVDGQHLLVALQDTNLLELFTIDQKTGKITKVQQIKSNNSPTIVAFFS